MNIDANFSVFLSFVVFAYLFKEKIYPYLVGYLDEYIASVKNKIQQCEDLKKQAYSALKSAYSGREAVKGAIAVEQKKMDERVARLRLESEEYLKSLKSKNEAALKAQLAAETAKQKNLLIAKLSDAVVDEIEQQIISGKSKFVINIEKSDIRKLLGEKS